MGSKVKCARSPSNRLSRNHTRTLSSCYKARRNSRRMPSPSCSSSVTIQTESLTSERNSLPGQRYQQTFPYKNIPSILLLSHSQVYFIFVINLILLSSTCLFSLHYQWNLKPKIYSTHFPFHSSCSYYRQSKSKRSRSIYLWLLWCTYRSIRSEQWLTVEFGRTPEGFVQLRIHSCLKIQQSRLFSSCECVYRVSQPSTRNI